MHAVDEEERRPPAPAGRHHPLEQEISDALRHLKLFDSAPGET
jgi:hypothetical protein